MVRNKKGVTLGTLAIMIIVMLIIFGITVSSGTDLLRNSEKNRLKTNLYIIKARAEVLLEDYLFDGTDNLGTEASSSQITAVGFEESDDYIYRVWDVSKLEEEGIDTENVSDSESFVIQYDTANDTVDVASTKGFTDGDGNAIYILSELN